MISRAEYLWWTLVKAEEYAVLVIRRSQSVLALQGSLCGEGFYLPSIVIQHYCSVEHNSHPPPSLLTYPALVSRTHIVQGPLAVSYSISVWRYRYAPTHTVLFSLPTCGEGTVLIRGTVRTRYFPSFKDDSYCIGRLFASSSPLY